MKAIHSGNITPRQHTIKEYKFALNELAKEITPRIRKETSEQLLAVVLYTLATCHGWGKIRLTRFVREVGGSFEDMEGVGFANKFDTLDLLETIRRKYGIDLRSEITVAEEKGSAK